ncbi:MAG: hypothetical protein C3F18_00305 [Nitrosomonadales bacterium]|nr:MAG: hypothetical protein C3F18_00305 [Nitrosomonadales bacterium]
MMLSVVIPAFNAARFIADAVKSVRLQAAHVQEIIIVDDGSTDDTGQVIAGLGEDIKYVRQQNAGPSAARNRGVAMASAPWIAFLDADDVWTANKISEQLAVLQANPGLGLVASDMAEIDITGELIRPSVLAAHGLLPFFQALNCAPIPHALRRLAEKNFIPTGTVIARKDLLVELGGFRPDIRYGEDLELWARIAARAPVVCLPRVHLLRRQHSSNATRATVPMLRDLVKVMQNLRAACGPELRAQGADPDALVAGALFDLGFWFFTAGELGMARSAFDQSLSAKPSLKTALYATASRLPAALLREARKARRFLEN